MSKEVLLFSNGNTAFLEGEGQVPELQKNWFLLYVDFLVENGIDPTEVTFNLPGLTTAKVFKTEDGYNYSCE